MTTIKEFVEQEKIKLKEYFKEHDGSLDIFQVGNNPASNSYIKGKLKDAAELGVKATLYKMDENVSLDELHDTVNKSTGVGKIIQLPLPHFTQKDVEKFVRRENDVDGFSQNTFCTPCTPLGIIKYLEANDYIFEGKTALVIGRSEIVGKPMAKLLLDRNCTVIQAHSKTTNLKELVSIADLIIVATGKINTLTCDMIYKPNCYVIDVGINRDESGKLIGDCERDLPVEFQSPVPGGVGLLTRISIFYNLKILLEHKEQVMKNIMKYNLNTSRNTFDILGISDLKSTLFMDEDDLLTFKEKVNNDPNKEYRIADIETKSFTERSKELDDKYFKDLEKASLYDGGFDVYKGDN